MDGFFEVLSVITAPLTTTIVTVIAGVMARDKKRAEYKASRREEESLLSMAMAAANNKLCIVTAKAVTNHKVNGDVEEALKEALEVGKAYSKFLVRTTAEHVAKD